MRSLQEDLAAYGLWIGILEPLMHSMASQIEPLRAIQQDLRARKDYEAADRLRAVIEAMQSDADYAFPGRYKRP